VSNQKLGENRQQYLNRARRYARNRFNALRETEFKHCHDSHCAARALEDTEKRFIDLGTFGVEGSTSDYGQDRFTIQYLNMGETYAPTICFYKERFIVACWGDIAERYSE
jgi:hypothetical protein